MIKSCVFIIVLVFVLTGCASAYENIDWRHLCEYNTTVIGRNESRLNCKDVSRMFDVNYFPKDCDITTTICTINNSFRSSQRTTSNCLSEGKYREFYFYNCNDNKGGGE